MCSSLLSVWHKLSCQRMMEQLRQEGPVTWYCSPTPAPRLTILSTDGFVGVGTTPTQMLHVNGNIRSNTGNFSSADATGLSFSSGSARLMTMLSSGNIGIGTEAPQEKLQVEGNILSQRVMTGTGVFGSHLEQAIYRSKPTVPHGSPY